MAYPESLATLITTLGLEPKALVAVGAIALVSVAWSLRRLSKWLRPKLPIDNLPGPRSSSWITGNLLEVFDHGSMQWHFDAIEKYGRIVKVHGLFNEDQLIVTDPRALNTIVMKEPHIFTYPDMIFAICLLSFGQGLVSVTGDQHTRQRKIMNPAFSTVHVRTLTPMFYEVAEQLCNLLEDKVVSGIKEIDLLDWMVRTAIECMGQGGLGYSFDAFNENQTDELTTALKAYIPAVTRLVIPMRFLPYARKLGPEWFQNFLVDILPIKSFRDFRETIRTMDRKAREIIKNKKRALVAEGPLTGDDSKAKDLMTSLMRANLAVSAKEQLSDEEIVGQVNSLTTAAQDTTSAALCRMIQYLCLHPDAQDRLRTELREAKLKHGKYIPYDDLMALTYLDAVVRETLRVDCPVPYIFRVAREATVLPLMRPIEGTDGKLITEVPVAKHQNILLGIAAVNRDPAIWGSDASEWRPERWLVPLPESVSEARLPAAFAGMMTFNGGSRTCLGMRFVLLEIKVVLSSLIERFSFELSADKEVTWMMYEMMKPVVKGVESAGPTFPVKIKTL